MHLEWCSACGTCASLLWLRFRITFRKESTHNHALLFNLDAMVEPIAQTRPTEMVFTCGRALVSDPEEKFVFKAHDAVLNIIVR